MNGFCLILGSDFFALTNYLMFLKAAPGERRTQLTPAVEKIFNRVLARVYRGSTRKKCSRERLLSLQHTELMKKANLPITIVTSRPANHTLMRKNETRHERSIYTEHFLLENNQMKKLSSYYSERSTEGSFQRPERCKTDVNKSRADDFLGKCAETASNLMIHSELFSQANNKIHHQPTSKNRLSLRPFGEQPQQARNVRNNHSEVIREPHPVPSRIKQMESRRKINTIIKTKNRLESQMTENNRKQLFEPWEVELNDDVYF